MEEKEYKITTEKNTNMLISEAIICNLQYIALHISHSKPFRLTIEFNPEEQKCHTKIESDLTSPETFLF